MLRIHLAYQLQDTLIAAQLVWSPTAGDNECIECSGLWGLCNAYVGFHLQTVFATLVESAARLCRADKATITWLKEHQLPVVATYGFSDEFTEYIRTRAPRLDRSSVAGRCLLERRPVQVPDVMNDPEFQFQEAATVGGFHTALGVPLMRQNTPIGVLFVARDKIEPFTQQQIDLIATFADQAVIAIENTRLFEAEQQRTRELSESLKQQTATSEVLQVISRYPGDLEPVFEAMLEKAVRLCDAKFGNMYPGTASFFTFWPRITRHLLSPKFADVPPFNLQLAVAR